MAKQKKLSLRDFSKQTRDPRLQPYILLIAIAHALGMKLPNKVKDKIDFIEENRERLEPYEYMPIPLEGTITQEELRLWYWFEEKEKERLAKLALAEIKKH